MTVDNIFGGSVPFSGNWVLPMGLPTLTKGAGVDGHDLSYVLLALQRQLTGPGVSTGLKRSVHKLASLPDSPLFMQTKHIWEQALERKAM